jgi:hypothetical protein
LSGGGSLDVACPVDERFSLLAAVFGDEVIGQPVDVLVREPPGKQGRYPQMAARREPGRVLPLKTPGRSSAILPLDPRDPAITRAKQLQRRRGNL